MARSGVDPYGEAVRLLAREASRLLEEKGATIEEKPEYLVSPPPRPEYGDLSFPAFRLARPLGMKPVEAAKLLASRVSAASAGTVVGRVEPVGGFVNVFLDAGELARRVFEAARTLGEGFGRVPVEKPLRIVIEHTSANPVHPLHIGHARNAALGDALARLLEARGHVVQRRFYIDDMGRQVAVLAYGMMKLSEKGGPTEPRGKPDHWIGLVYAVTHTLVDIRSVRRRLEEAREAGDEERVRELQEELDDLVGAAAELRERDPQLFDTLADAIMADEDPEETIARITRAYEFGEDWAVKLVRGAVEKCIEGFRETLEGRLGIRFDKWDWESDLVWGSLVGRLLEEARKSPYFTLHKEAEALDFKQLQRDPEVRERLGLPETLEIPPLILVRSDGTTLYTTRDIAYSIYKFRDFNADKVINVIAAEQRLPQLQIRLALIALGYRREAYNMIHYAYEMVNLPGVKMSGRRGRYVALDSLIDAAVQKAGEEIARRNRELGEERTREIARQVGVGAVKYALLGVNAAKPMVFNLDDTLNFERNTAPYIQYAHARASKILAKAGGGIPWGEVDYSAAEGHPARRRLLVEASRFPYIAAKAADELRPELVVEYLNGLAEIFNTWYPQDPVLAEADRGARAYKLGLVYLVKTVLRNALDLLGIPAPEEM